MRLRVVATLIVACSLARAAHAAGRDKQVAIVHLEARGKMSPVEIEPLEKTLAAELGGAKLTVIWADPAVAQLAIGVDPQACLDMPCRQRLGKALEAQYLAGGRIERRRDAQGAAVVDMHAWLVDAMAGVPLGEVNESSSGGGAAEMQKAWARAIRTLLANAHLAPQPEPAKAGPMSDAPAPGGAPVQPGATLTTPSSTRSSAEPATDRQLLSRRALKWYVGASGAALAAVGITYILLDGPRYASCSKDEGCLDGRDRLPERYDTLRPGIGMTAAGAALLAGAVYLWRGETTWRW